MNSLNIFTTLCAWKIAGPLGTIFLEFGIHRRNVLAGQLGILSTAGRK